MSDAVAFSIPLWADLLAVGIGSLQGAMFASQFRDRRLDLLGVAIIGVATGLGGGLLRDIFLVVPLVALHTNWYLSVAVLSALFGMLLVRLFERLDTVITILDALTIGLFGAIGTTKALSLGLPVIPSIFVGVVSAVGGSVVRDVLLAMPIALMHVGSLYAVAAGAGSAVLVMFWAGGMDITVAAVICVIVTTVVRLLAVRYGWSLPEQRAIRSMPRISRAALRPRWPRLRRVAKPGQR
ncbi:trimeric intracellular cation channel family protein [Agreia bicolorata]|uniref:Membrane protein n=1 Tax=Agreia bicolorata TaxID=110935 RepID=A0ABR5CIQ6_9MICO|nr:TRIC cation channel family protein [Agreia bicolorata]KJC65455.1 membrane protein [Agreia bicolorata]